jgi:glycosyl-4,4'-diaponeurosporenoate acyltransferase
MLYLFSIFGGGIIIALLNFIFHGIHTLPAFGIEVAVTFIQVGAVFLIDGIAAFIIRRLPKRWFAPEARLFSVSGAERGFLRAIGINKWKKHVPEWGCFTGFHKDRLREPNDSAYLGRFLLESNYGVVGHLAGALLGFLIVLFPIFGGVSVSLPVAAINMILSLLPTALLRYNTPALRSLYRRTRERELKKQEAEADVSCAADR